MTMDVFWETYRCKVIFRLTSIITSVAVRKICAAKDASDVDKKHYPLRCRHGPNNEPLDWQRIFDIVLKKCRDGHATFDCDTSARVRCPKFKIHPLLTFMLPFPPPKSNHSGNVSDMFRFHTIYVRAFCVYSDVARGGRVCRTAFIAVFARPQVEKRIGYC